MTDQRTQRYRPLADGEVIEEGDVYQDHDGYGLAFITDRRVGERYTIGKYAKHFRPIPETAWREPVGEAGYPYPPGTVVELDDEDRDSAASQVFIGPDCLYWFLDDKVVKPIFYQSYGMIESHRVIDYRPDLVTQQTAADETQTDLSSTDETQDLLPCPFCGPAKIDLESLRLRSHDGDATQVVHCRECGCYGPPSYYDAGNHEHYWNQRPSSESSELTRLRAEVERLELHESTLMAKVKGLTKEMERRTVYNGKSAQEWYTLYCQSALKEKRTKPKTDRMF